MKNCKKLVTKNYSSNLSKATCYRAINWLYHSGIIGFCGKITELDILNSNREAAASRWILELHIIISPELVLLYQLWMAH